MIFSEGWVFGGVELFFDGINMLYFLFLRGMVFYFNMLGSQMCFFGFVGMINFEMEGLNVFNFVFRLGFFGVSWLDDVLKILDG